MKFGFDTTYDQEAMTAMARAMRLTVRRKFNRRTRIFGWITVLLGVLTIAMAGMNGHLYSGGTMFMMAAVLALAVVLIFEDRMNGWLASKRMLKGTERAKSAFYEDLYVMTTELGETKWYYDKIVGLAETKGFFVLFLSESHGQVFNKSSLTGGTAEMFKSFITQKTGLQFESVRG